MEEHLPPAQGERGSSEASRSTYRRSLTRRRRVPRGVNLDVHAVDAG